MADAGEPADASGPEPIVVAGTPKLLTELKAIELVLNDERFQVPDLATKKRILKLLPVPSETNTRTFDAVMTTSPVPPLAPDNIDEYIDDLRLIELKSTRASIQNASLNGFFFGATKREYDLAASLGARYLFAFVVLSTENDYRRPFFVLLALDDLEKRTRTKRIQYQINLRTDGESIDAEAHFGRYDAVIEGGDPFAS